MRPVWEPCHTEESQVGCPYPESHSALRFYPESGEFLNATEFFARSSCVFIVLIFCYSEMLVYQIRDAHSQTPIENDAPDSGQHHFGTPWKCIPGQGHERRRAGLFGKNSESRPDCFSSAGVRLHLAR